MAHAQAGVALCRFCLDHEDVRHLITPCRCIGSQTYVHLFCLRQWQASVQGERRASVCSVCDAPFHPAPPARSWIQPVLVFLCEIPLNLIALLELLSHTQSSYFLAAASFLIFMCLRTVAVACLVAVGKLQCLQSNHCDLLLTIRPSSTLTHPPL
eukprot:m.15686 g.15686  ORF g.15686 m.15686 type:complete len:155 (-) comp3055_c0_seq2:87-551(-)